MQNIYKTIYFDISLFFALPFSTWLRMTFSKYKCILFVSVFKRFSIFHFGKQSVHVRNISDLGTTVSSLSDEYWHLYKVLDGKIHQVIDVGANIGQFALAIRTWYPHANIRSYEADPKTYKNLQKNTSSNEIHTHNLALSNAEGRLKFYRSPISVTSSLIQTALDHECIQVEASTLDLVTRDLGNIDLLKIDVEGAELKVLKGARATLSKTKFLLLEISFLRETEGVSNLDVLNEIHCVCKKARIIHTGRKLGWRNHVSAQDFLIELGNK